MRERGLSSSEIDQGKLLSVVTVLQKYQNLCGQIVTESNLRQLCVKLAKEAVFGEDVTKRCTPSGTRDLLRLPLMNCFY